MFKRLMPARWGMAYLIRRRTAHIVIGLSDLATVLKTADDEVENKTDAKSRK